MTQLISYTTNVRRYFAPFTTFQELLNGDTLATVISVTPSPNDSIIVVGSGTINSSTLTINGINYPPNTTVYFEVSGGASGTYYNLIIIVTTAGSSQLTGVGTLYMSS